MSVLMTNDQCPGVSTQPVEGAWVCVWGGGGGGVGLDNFPPGVEIIPDIYTGLSSQPSFIILFKAEATFVKGTRMQKILKVFKTLSCWCSCWKTFDEYYQMSSHVPGFQAFFRSFASFYICKISQQQHKG